MNFEALALASVVLPLCQRSSVLICETWELRIDARVDLLSSGVGICVPFELLVHKCLEINLGRVNLPFMNSFELGWLI
jgi:hypothetical protein